MASIASKTPQVPQELVNMIIDELCDDSDALKATGLANTRFYLRTRRHLFKEIFIGENKPEERVALLIDVLKSNPTLQTCVRELELDNDTDADSKGWIVENPSAATRVVELLPLLLNLTKLRLRGGKQDLSWLDVPVSLQSGLLGGMAQHTRTLQKLELDTISDFDVETIGRFIGLEELVINFLEYAKLVLKSRDQPSALLAHQSPPTAGPASGEPRLGIFRVTMSGDVWREIMWYAKNTPHARHLLYPKELVLNVLDWDEQTVGAWSDFLELSAPYLEVLDMCFDAYEPLQDRASVLYPIAVLNFTRFTNLGVLVFRCYSEYLHVPECNPFPDFLDALEAMAQSNSTQLLELRSMVIVFVFRQQPDDPYTFNLSEFMPNFAVDECWSRLCDIVCMDAFENLQTEGNILISFDFDDEDLELEEWLSAKGKIEESLEDIADVVDIARDGQVMERGNASLAQ